MKKSHKLIVALIFLIIILLIIFLSKDFIIRKYFISKLENVDYDEYILELSINEKPSRIYYYTPESVMERHYNNDGNLKDFIIVNNFIENSQYYYYLNDNEITQGNVEFHFSDLNTINNHTLLNLLNKNYNNIKNTLKYIGIKDINNIKCYVLKFKIEPSTTFTIYLNKELLYIVRIDTHTSNSKENTSITNTNNNHIIYDYTLDLTLNKKYLFEF